MNKYKFIMKNYKIFATHLKHPRQKTAENMAEQMLHANTRT